MNYLISTPKPTDLKIEIDDLIKHLQTKWANIEIGVRDNPQQVYQLEWIIPRENISLEGAFSQTRQCVALDGNVRHCAEFALWFRSLVDCQYKLFFYDQGYSADIELRQETTLEDIVNLFVLNPVDELSLSS
jgi:hypothetical protein